MAADICTGKQSWPELLGKKGSEAKMTIEKENPFVKAIIVTPRHVVSHDYICQRVWVWVDISGNVLEIPIIG